MSRYGILLLLFCLACESKIDRENRELADQLIAKYRADSIAKSLLPEPSPALAVNPCSKPRPYKSWSNGELSAAILEYMGKPESQGLIAEVACRDR